MKRYLVIATFGLTLFMAGTVQASPLRSGEGIVKDPTAGGYLAAYWDEDETGGELVTAVLSNATQIEPEVFSTINLLPNETIKYGYRIRNGIRAKQGIISFGLFGLPYTVQIINSAHFGETDSVFKVDLFSGALVSPHGWIGSGARVSRLQIANLGWHYHRSDMPLDESKIDYRDGIRPGDTLAGFGLISAELPGMVVAHVKGNVGWGDKFRPLGEPTTDSDIFQQMERLEENNFVSRNIAAPFIIVPSQFNAALVLESIRTHVATWHGKQLVDSVFASRLDQYLGAAAESFRLNQPKAGKEHIATIRKLLAKEHHHVDHDDDDDEDTEEHKRATRFTIDRLAARVLDFDLRYVLKRTERDHDDHGQKKH